MDITVVKQDFPCVNPCRLFIHLYEHTYKHIQKYLYITQRQTVKISNDFPENKAGTALLEGIHNPAAFGVCHRAACGIWELLQTTQELRKLLLCSTAPLINYISSEYPQHQVSRRNKMPWERRAVNSCTPCNFIIICIYNQRPLNQTNKFSIWRIHFSALEWMLCISNACRIQNYSFPAVIHMPSFLLSPPFITESCDATRGEVLQEENCIASLPCGFPTDGPAH